MYVRIVLLLILGCVFFIGIDPMISSTRDYSHHAEHIPIPTLIIAGKIGIALLTVGGVYRLFCQKSNSKQNSLKKKGDGEP